MRHLNIYEAFMPKLKQLNILGNIFTDKAIPIIKGLRNNNIRVDYSIQ